MIALVQNHVINVLALRRETKTARVQPLAEILIQFFLNRAHKIKLEAKPSAVKI